MPSSTVKSPPATPPGRSCGSAPPASPPARPSTSSCSTTSPASAATTSPRLAAGHYLTEARNVVLLGPPGTGKTHLATALGIAACHAGHRVLFATATDWVTRLTDAHQRGRLPAELTRLRRYGLIVIDEVGYLPFAQDAANLFFQLVSCRYEHASLILTSNLPVRPLGRRVRRPNRRRRHDRPDRPPRRRPHPQRRQLPPQTPHRRRHPSQRPRRAGTLNINDRGPLLKERTWSTPQRASTGATLWACDSANRTVSGSRSCPHSCHNSPEDSTGPGRTAGPERFYHRHRTPSRATRCSTTTITSASTRPSAPHHHQTQQPA